MKLLTREVALQECLSYELTQLPASLFDNEKQTMRNTNKALLASALKDKIPPTKLTIFPAY